MLQKIIGRKEEQKIDLVIDRRDQTINLCEMKFSMKPFEITPSYLEHIIYRRELFRETTGTSKALHLTFVTTYGVARNAQYGMIQSEITMDDLFKQIIHCNLALYHAVLGISCHSVSRNEGEVQSLAGTSGFSEQLTAIDDVFQIGRSNLEGLHRKLHFA